MRLFIESNGSNNLNPNLKQARPLPYQIEMKTGEKTLTQKEKALLKKDQRAEKDFE